VKGFSNPVVDVLTEGKIIGVRAGTDEHRFIGVWVVVVNGRVFVRSWNDKPHGWYRAFDEDSRGTIQIPGGREIRIRARKAKGERLLDAIDRAYAAKYNTPGSRKYVRGFATARRRKNTVELLPR
jgi:hypothetical protein